MTVSSAPTHHAPTHQAPTHPVRSTRRLRSLGSAGRTATLLGLSTTLTLAGCGTTTDGQSAGTSPAGTASASPSAPPFTPATGGELNLYTWTDYFPTAMVERFKKETGITLKVSFYESNEDLEAKLKATDGAGYDLVVPSDYMTKVLIDAGLLKKTNPTSLPNGKNLAPAFLDVYFDKGREYSVPYLYGTTGIAYDSALVTTPITSWKDYFAGPAAAEGKIGIFNDQVEVVNAALRATGSKPCTSDPKELQAAQDLLVAFKPKVKTVSSEGNTGRMSSGESVVSMLWNGSAHRAKAKRSTIVYVYPSEGTALWQDGFVMPKGAVNEAQALTFLNWMMDPHNIAEAANAQGYNAGYTGIEAYLDASMKSDPAVVVPATEQSKVAPVMPCDAKTNNAYTKIFEAFKN